MQFDVGVHRASSTGGRRSGRADHQRRNSRWPGALGGDIHTPRRLAMTSAVRRHSCRRATPRRQPQATHRRCASSRWRTARSVPPTVEPRRSNLRLASPPHRGRLRARPATHRARRRATRRGALPQRTEERGSPLRFLRRPLETTSGRIAWRRPHFRLSREAALAARAAEVSLAGGSDSAVGRRLAVAMHGKQQRDSLAILRLDAREPASGGSRPSSCA
jgi:hypothetical protein